MPIYLSVACMWIHSDSEGEPAHTCTQSLDGLGMEERQLITPDMRFLSETERVAGSEKAR